MIFQILLFVGLLVLVLSVGWAIPMFVGGVMGVDDDPPMQWLIGLLGLLVILCLVALSAIAVIGLWDVAAKIMQRGGV